MVRKQMIILNYIEANKKREEHVVHTHIENAKFNVVVCMYVSNCMHKNENEKKNRNSKRSQV